MQTEADMLGTKFIDLLNTVSQKKAVAIELSILFLTKYKSLPLFL